jgi:hypothetical protein
MVRRPDWKDSPVLRREKSFWRRKMGRERRARMNQMLKFRRRFLK